MKLAANVPVPYFYYPSAVASRRRPARRVTAVRREPLTPIEESDELAHKQEVVCAAILGLSLVSTVVLCMWQLVTA